MKAWLIVNPMAGTATGEPAERAIAQLAARHGVEVQRTGEAGHARELAADAVRSGADLVIAAGGDGTVSEVVNGMSADFDAARLAIVPLGTANDFAYTLGVHGDDLDAALGAIDGGVERRIDLIRAHGENANGAGEPPRYVINAATGGFSEVVHDRLTADVKHAWGPLAYLRAAVDAVADICYHDATIRLDGETVLTDTCSVVIANGRSAGGMELDPAAKVDDGRIDVIIITAQTFLEDMRLASRYLAGTHLDSPHVIFRRARQVEVATDPPMGFSSDGELVGRTPVHFEIVPRALRVLTPRGAATD